MGDSYVEAFGLEEAAFRAFALSHPGPVTLLVDTHGNDRSMEYDERRTVE
jgi:nicotinate phosphoribosyltransferase